MNVHHEITARQLTFWYTVTRSKVTAGERIPASRTVGFWTAIGNGTNVFTCSNIRKTSMHRTHAITPYHRNGKLMYSATGAAAAAADAVASVTCMKEVNIEL